MKLFNALGLNLYILIAQLVNFAILVFVLYKFAYNPILDFLKDRREKIEKGVLNAKKADEKMEEVKIKEEEILKEAKKKGREIAELAKQEGEKKRKKIIENTKEEIGQIINQEKEKMRAEKGETLKQAKKEIAELVTLSLEKVLDIKMDSEEDKKIIQKTIKSLK
ncbi:F0F1 ATP synthase subunit B [bacterium]|nr:F0F1 ATP synthase subunit B [bacterium]